MDKTLIYGVFETIGISIAGQDPKMKNLKFLKIDFKNFSLNYFYKNN
jgi:hypothetical protein